MGRSLWPSLVLLAGCMRGCPASCGGGEPATPCTTEGDCQLTETCHDGFCADRDTVAALERCRSTPECKQRGACVGGLTRSFLGANSHPTCLVERAEDCAASEACADAGKCALARTPGAMSDGYCAARDPKRCEASRRCAQFEECTLDGDACVRAWSGCSGAPMPRIDPGLDLGAAWHPGAVTDAIVACVLDTRTRETTTFVRVGERCLRGPDHRRVQTGFVFRTTLDATDRVALAIQKNPELGTPKIARYVRAAYTGTSPFRGAEDKVTMTCHVVPPALAAERAAPVLARAKAEIARIETAPPLDRAEPAAAPAAREALAEARAWLGAAPEVAKLQVAYDERVAGWHRALDAAIGKLAPADAGPKGARLRVIGTVCGDALRARTGRTLAGELCAAEISVRASEPIHLGVAGDLSNLRLLRPGPDAAALEVELLEVAGAASSGAYRELPAGGEASLLVIPTPAVPIGPGWVFTGSGFGGTPRFVLRLDR